MQVLTAAAPATQLLQQSTQRPLLQPAALFRHINASTALHTRLPKLFQQALRRTALRSVALFGAASACAAAPFAACCRARLNAPMLWKDSPEPSSSTPSSRSGASASPTAMCAYGAPQPALALLPVARWQALSASLTVMRAHKLRQPASARHPVAESHYNNSASKCRDTGQP